MRKYEYNLQTFFNEDALSYYLLGAFMTDGCVYLTKPNANTHKSKSTTVSIVSKDCDWLQAINQHICPERSLYTHKNKTCYSALFGSKAIGEWLINKGCTPKKSLTLSFPDVPRKYLPDFIRGCWDGDGCIVFSKSGNNGTTYQRKADITSSSLSFLEGMSAALNSYGIGHRIWERPPSVRKIDDRIISNDHPNYRLILSNGEETYKLVKIIYYEGATLAMPRKLKISQDLITDWERPFYCLDCNAVLSITKKNRKKRLCPVCRRMRKHENQKRSYLKMKEMSSID